MERTARIPADLRASIRAPKRLLSLRSDPRLVDLVRAGDETAFEVLYERHVAGVLSFCRHMLGSQDEAEDAVQQAFVSANEAMRRGSREIAFKPWLYTIARNRCLSVLRARREQPAELPELSTAGLNEQVEHRADLRELLLDVQRLPEQQRAALVLSELGDLSHSEVAEVIGQEPRTVKGLVFRARAALAERRDARVADCGEIRVELADATGGGLRRSRLRYHLESCPACVAYLDEVRRQRRLLGLALPVVPTLALKDGVMGSIGIGAGSAGTVGAVASGGGAAGAAGAGATAAGGAATAGGALVGGAAVKLAVAGAILAGGAGVATGVVRESGDEPPATPPAVAREAAPGVTGVDARGKVDDRARAGGPAERALERRRGARGAERRALGRERASERSGGRSAAGQPRGKALGRIAPPAQRNGGPVSGGRGGAPGRGERAPSSSPSPRQGATARGAPGARAESPGRAPAAPVATPRAQPPAAPLPPAAGGDVVPERAKESAGNPHQSPD